MWCFVVRRFCVHLFTDLNGHYWLALFLAQAMPGDDFGFKEFGVLGSVCAALIAVIYLLIQLARYLYDTCREEKKDIEDRHERERTKWYEK